MVNGGFGSELFTIYYLLFTDLHLLLPILPLDGCQLLRFLADVVKTAAVKERLLGDVVEVAVDQFLERGDRLIDSDVSAGVAGELLGNEVRLRKESLNLSSAAYELLVVVGKFVDTEDRDDVLQFLIALQSSLHASGDCVVLGSHDARVEVLGAGVQRVHGGIQALGCGCAVQIDVSVKVSERRCRSGVGRVVRRDVDRLHRRNRSLLGRSDALLKEAHFRSKGWLVADSAGHTTQKCRNLRTCLHESENVVDEDENVAAHFVAEILGHRKRGQSDSKSCSWRLVHLAEDHRRLVDNGLLGAVLIGELRVLHFQPKVVSFASSLSHAGKDGDAGCFNRDVSDELLNQNCFAQSRTAEESDLSTLVKGDHQVDDFQTGLQDLDLGRLLIELGGLAVDGHLANARAQRLAVIDGLAEKVEHTAEGLFADGNLNGGSGIDRVHAADESVGGGEGDRSDDVVSQVLGDFNDEVDAALLVPDGQSVVDLGQAVAAESAVDNGAEDLDDFASARHGFRVTSSGWVKRAGRPHARQILYLLAPN